MSFTLPPFKTGPFKLTKSKDEWPGYLKLLAMHFEGVEYLPNFNEDKGVMIFSDYGGEHPKAAFNTLSFLIVSADKIGPFRERVEKIRLDYKVGTTEISFKDINYGPVSRALSEYLDAANTLLHGLLLTVAIDINIHSVFGTDKQAGRENVELTEVEVGKGEWGYKRLEKMYRIYGVLVLVLDLLCDDGQKIMWQSDEDTINQDGNKATFQDAIHHFWRIQREYSEKKFDGLRFAKSFKEHSFYSDLLSLPDLTAGMVQDLLRHKLRDGNVEVNETKGTLCQWLAADSHFLQRLNLCIVKKDEQIVLRPFDINPASYSEG